MILYEGYDKSLRHDVVYFAENLYEVDEYDFPDDERPGWYYYDSEYGYLEKRDVRYWMPLPEVPDEKTDEGT